MLISIEYSVKVDFCVGQISDGSINTDACGILCLCLKLLTSSTLMPVASRFYAETIARKYWSKTLIQTEIAPINTDYTARDGPSTLPLDPYVY